MSTALAQSLGVLLSTLDDFQKSNGQSFSPALGFSGYIYKETGIIPSFLTDSNLTLDAKRLFEAPIIASVGYAMHIGLWQSILPDESTWLQSVERLQKREVFPVDRSSFAFRPLEVVGIALGLSRCKARDVKQNQWLKDVLSQLGKMKNHSFWETTLYTLALDILGATQTIFPLRQWSEIAPVEVALARWVGQVSKSFSLFSENNFAALDEVLLNGCLTSNPRVRDVAEAAVLSYALRQAISIRLKSATAETWLLSRNAQDTISVVESICRRFPLFAKQLLKRHNNRTCIEIKDEYDVQDLVHALLHLHFEDVRPEETTPSHGGNTARMDFLLMPQQVVVEVKMTRKSLGQREIVSQLAEDKERYKSHPNCRTLICFVYDPAGYCEKPNALEKDLSETNERMRTVVIVSPKGL